MVDVTPKGFGKAGPSTSRAEIEALSEIIAASIGMAVRARSEAAAALLERALAALQNRFAAGGTADGAREAGEPDR